MTSQEYYEGQRLSLKSQLCTVRYIGSVANRQGTYLGVEWDDPNRGKNDGTHEGTTYFKCRSISPTAASFIRPTQPWDTSRTFLQALQEKYMPSFHKDEVEVVYISGKQAEEIGFEKFSQRQTKLQGIHVLVLDHMRIRHHSPGEVEVRLIREYCAEITELDLSGNLFETFDEIVRLCSLLPKLRVLTIAGNRFRIDIEAVDQTLPTVKSLNLSRTLLSFTEISRILLTFPALTTLSIAENEIQEGPIQLALPTTLTTLDLSDNLLTSLNSLHTLSKNCPPTLILKRNNISTSTTTSTNTIFTLPVAELDLTYNAISTFSFFNDLNNSTTFPALRHLRVTGNPVYKALVSADGRPLATEEGYMLTIARLPRLEYLNYAKTTEKERLNAETYYLTQIALQISLASSDREAETIAKHPRWHELCDEYGEPTIQRKSRKAEIDPNTLAAKLVTCTFTLGPSTNPTNAPQQQQTWMQDIPKSFNIYSVLGLVGKRLGIMPLDLRLVLQTDEQDPVGMGEGYNGPECWDSSDDDSEMEDQKKPQWVRREVELVAGTRGLGTYVEGREARIRVEMKQGSGR